MHLLFPASFKSFTTIAALVLLIVDIPVCFFMVGFLPHIAEDFRAIGASKITGFVAQRVPFESAVIDETGIADFADKVPEVGTRVFHQLFERVEYVLADGAPHCIAIKSKG